jgi:alkylhydroperoxidase family enzyme
MARLPYVDPAAAPESVREALAGLASPLRIFRMVAHAETNLRPFLRFGGSILAQQQLDARLREMAILRVANVSHAPYEWTQHVPIAKAVGVSEEQVKALAAGDTTADCFEGRDQLVLRFTDEIMHDVRASDATFAAMAEQFPPREIVELILAVGFYMLVARLLETTAVDMDLAAGTAVVDAMKRER